ncbi:MAG: hypothetical protein PHP32_01540 [Candidatus Izemoplasmatales bacterium]|nr:hypothetical protein [Candidatus Izemoplasmatales bacterium]
MKKALKRNQIYFFSFLVITAVLFILAGLIWITSWNFDVKMLVFVLLIILLLVESFWFQPRVLFYSQQANMIRLKEQASPAITYGYNPMNVEGYSHIVNLGFKAFIDNDEISLLYRIERNPYKKIAKSGILEIVVLLKSSKFYFQSIEIQHIINRLEDDLAKQKLFLPTYTILVLQAGDKITEEIQNSLQQVMFDRISQRNTVLINGFYETNSGLLHYLHSDTYSPSVYYRWACDLMAGLSQKTTS